MLIIGVGLPGYLLNKLKLLHFYFIGPRPSTMPCPASVQNRPCISHMIFHLFKKNRRVQDCWNNGRHASGVFILPPAASRFSLNSARLERHFRMIFFISFLSFKNGKKGHIIRDKDYYRHCKVNNERGLGEKVTQTIPQLERPLPVGQRSPLAFAVGI